MRLFCLALLSLLMVLPGCSRGPRALPLEPPCIALEKAKEAAKNDPLVMETQEWLPSNWWLLFNDAQLDCLIQTAFARNPSLQAAEAKILLAKSNADRVRSSLFPYVWWGGDVGREKLSKTGVIPFESQSIPIQGTRIPFYFTQYETQLNLTFDFDIWGKNRNTLRAAIGEMRANIADEAFARLQLGIALAQVYFRLQIDYRREEVLKKYVASQTEYNSLVGGRVVQGVDNALSHYTSETNLATAKQSLLQVQQEIAVNETQLKTYLAGDFDEGICKTHIEKMPLPKVPLPTNLPLHLLAHRPDIVSQIWLIESAGRQIDVARAGFFPDFNLTAFFGFQTIHFRELFRWASSYFNVDPAFTLPIFDAGRLAANLRGSEINYDLAVLKYNELVLNAAKEVFDGLSILRNQELQLQQYVQKLTSQEQNFALTTLRLQNGIDSKLSFLTAEQNTLSAEDQKLTALANTIDAMLNLIKSLGGGYGTMGEDR